MSKLSKYLSKLKNFNFEDVIDIFEKENTYNIIENTNLLLEYYPELEEELIQGNVYQVSLATLTPNGGIDIFDVLSLNQTFEDFTKLTKREIVSLNKDVYEIDARYIINNLYTSKAYVLRVKNIGSFQWLLGNYQMELEEFPVYFGNKPIYKNLKNEYLHGELLDCQLETYYNERYINSYPIFSKRFNYSDSIQQHSDLLNPHNNNVDRTQGIHLQGFPSAKTVAKESVHGLLQETLQNIKEATQRGETSITTVDPLEVEFIFLNIENFEMMKYEVGFDYDNHLDMDDDQLWVEDMHSAYISWGHQMHSRN